MTTANEHHHDAGDIVVVRVPLNLWERITKAIETGKRLPDLTRRAPLGFDLDPFCNGCRELLREMGSLR